MKKKGRSSGKWEEPWWELLNIEAILDKIPFFTGIKDKHAKIDCYINYRDYESAQVMRESFPRLFPTSSHYFRAIIYIGDKVMKTGLLKIRKNEIPVHCNSFIRMAEISEEFLRIAHLRGAAENHIMSVADEYWKGTLTDEETQAAIGGIIQVIDEKLKDEVKNFAIELFSPESVVKNKSKLRMRDFRVRKSSMSDKPGNKSNSLSNDPDNSSNHFSDSSKDSSKNAINTIRNVTHIGEYSEVEDFANFSKFISKL